MASYSGSLHAHGTPIGPFGYYCKEGGKGLCNLVRSLCFKIASLLSCPRASQLHNWRTAVALHTLSHISLSTYLIVPNVPSPEYQYDRSKYRSRPRYLKISWFYLHLSILTRRYYSIDDRPYPPRSAPYHAPQGEPGFVDSSGPIFSMYMEMAEEEDKKMAESWQADADGILIFVRTYLPALCLIPTHQL